MKIEDIKPGDVLVAVDGNGAAYAKVVKVNRVTVDVLDEYLNPCRARPHVFDRKVNYPVAAFTSAQGTK